MKRSNPDYSDQDILEAQDDLFYELRSTSSVYICNELFEIYELLEDIDEECKDTIISMLVIGNDEAKEYAIEVLWNTFKSNFDSEVIAAHLTNEGESY